MTIKTLVESFFVMTIFFVMALVGWTYLFLSSQERLISNQKALQTARSLLEAQIPFITSEMEYSNESALRMRAQVLQATHFQKGLKVILFDKNDNLITTEEPVFLHVNANKIETDLDGQIIDDKFAISDSPIMIGSDKMGRAIFSVQIDHRLLDRIKSVFNKSFAALLILLTFGLISIRFFIGKYWLQPSLRLVKNLEQIDAFLQSDETQSPFFNEIEKNGATEFVLINRVLDRMILNLRNSISERNKLAEDATKVKVQHEISKQVAHDIRSPISALNMILGHISNMPEHHRVIMRNAVNRVNDIANTLLSKSSKNENPSLSQANALEKTQSLNEFCENSIKLKTELLSAVLELIITEKRMQNRNYIDVLIEADLSESYGCFALVNTIELQRIISNLVNNSVEGLKNRNGKIKVSVKKINIEKHKYGEIEISVQDDGHGISSELIAKIGQKGVTVGKEGSTSGSGLGLYHAKKTIENMKGRLEIRSAVGVGTKVSLILPEAPSPKWFVEKIDISEKSLIVSIDDDNAIHSIWASRLKNTNQNYQHLSFSSTVDFKEWYNTHYELEKLIITSGRSEFKSAIFLIDYEFLGQSLNGIDLIQELGIHSNSILVTSRFEEDKIITQCIEIGLKVIPKGMAGFVPICFETESFTVPNQMNHRKYYEDKEI